VHEALAAVLEADPDRRVWHPRALMSGTHEDLARELDEAGERARRRGAVALTALWRAVQLSAPDYRVGRMFATADLAFERGRPDIANAMLREIERLELTPWRPRERGTSASSWMRMRWLIARAWPS
jgi:hypothetical protein